MKLRAVQFVRDEAYGLFDGETLVLNVKRDRKLGFIWAAVRTKDNVCIDADQFRADLFERLNMLHEKGELDNAPPYSDTECGCGNPEMGFDCVCDWVRENPGETEYSCEFCGIYKGGAPKCNHCESE